MIGGINPLGGSGGGVPGLVGLVVTKDAGTFVTDSCCVFEVEGLSKVMGHSGNGVFLLEPKTCLAVSSFNFWILKIVP